MDWLVWGILEWLVRLLLLAAAILAGLWSYRVFRTGDTSLSFSWLFPSRPEPRLAVVEQIKVDRMRRLVLIRRDDMEYLMMIGGPIDVPIGEGFPAQSEEGVYVNGAERVGGAHPERPAHQERQEPEPPVFARKARFGQAVSE